MSLLLSSPAVGLTDLMEVREMLEVPGAGVAAARRTDEDLSALARTMFDPVRDEVAIKLVAHRDFHAVLAAATGNPVYELLARPLYALGNLAEIAERATLRLWKAVDAEHRAILAAVIARDVSGAERATRTHLENLRANWPDG